MSETDDIFDEARWSVEETRRWAREHKAKQEARTQAEKDREWVSWMNDIWESMASVVDCYLSAIEFRLESLNYDWRSLSAEEKIAMFDQAARDAAKHLPTQIASYLEEQARDRFESQHNVES